MHGSSSSLVAPLGLSTSWGRTPTPPISTWLVRGPTTKELKQIFPWSITTGFGGIRAKVYPDDPNVPYLVDIWPLDKTYGFTREPKRPFYSWPDLLTTCCFNVEAIAIDPINSEVYEAGFFECMSSKTLELVSPHVASITLVLVRAMVFARRYGLTFGPKLSQFIQEKGPKLSLAKVMQLQLMFFGVLKVTCKDFSDTMGVSYEGYPGCRASGCSHCDAKSGLPTGV